MEMKALFNVRLLSQALTTTGASPLLTQILANPLAACMRLDPLEVPRFRSNALLSVQPNSIKLRASRQRTPFLSTSSACTSTVSESSAVCVGRISAGFPRLVSDTLARSGR